MGRKTLEKLKEEEKLHDKQSFKSDSHFYCPYCKKRFTYRRMWKQLVTDFNTIWDLVEFTKYSYTHIRKIVTRFNFDVFLSGTSRHNSWYVLAERARFKSPVSMFYSFHIKKRYPYKKMAKLLGIADWKEVRDAADTFLNPDYEGHYKEKGHMEKRKTTQRNGGKKHGKEK